MHFKKDIHYKILTKDLTEENFAPQVAGAKAAPQVGGAAFPTKNLGTIGFLIKQLLIIQLRLRQKHNFTQEKDYKITLIRTDERVHGGQNKETIMLNINTFNKLKIVKNLFVFEQVRNTLAPIS